MPGGLVPCWKPAFNCLLLGIPAVGGFQLRANPLSTTVDDSWKIASSPSTGRAAWQAVTGGGASICAGARVTGASGWLIRAVCLGVAVARPGWHWGCQVSAEGVSLMAQRRCCWHGACTRTPASLDRCCAATHPCQGSCIRSRMIADAATSQPWHTVAYL